MKRFIDLGDQTGNVDHESGEREFAFYCTTIDQFESFGFCQTWTSIEDFKQDFEGDDIERYLNLIPEDFFTHTK